MTDQPVDLEHIDRFASLSDDVLATVTKAGTHVEAAFADRSVPPA